MGLLPEEIPQQILADRGQDRLRVKLNPFHRMLPVAEPHDLPFGCLCRDLKTARKILPVDEEAVIASRLKGIRQLSEEGLPVMSDQGSLPMHEPSGLNNPPPKRGSDALVPETDPQDGDPTREVGDQIARDSRLLGGARARRNDNPSRVKVVYPLQGDFVISDHFDPLAQLPEVLNQVVREGIVIVDHQNHISSRFTVHSSLFTLRGILPVFTVHGELWTNERLSVVGHRLTYEPSKPVSAISMARSMAAALLRVS